MISGVDVDWGQLAAALTSMAMIAAGFAWAVRHIVHHEFGSLKKGLDGTLDRRIDRRIDAKIKPLEKKVNRIDDELAQALPDYRGAP